VKNYKHFSVNDFVLDDYFQSWILNHDENSEAFWASWLLEHPEKANDVREAKGILQHLRLSNYSLTPAAVSEIWKRVQHGEDPSLKPRQSGIVYRMYWAAAAAILVLGIGFFLSQPKPTHLEYVTAFGETKTILLPDSSTVILNANSRLSFTTDWDHQPVREIWLEGEGFFSVTHKHNNQPFKVLTKAGVAVEVLGTTFNVYQRSVDTKVVLNSGQIRLSLTSNKKEETILMKPGELVEYKKNNYSKRTVDPKIYAAWTEKKIILNLTSLEEVIRMVRDNYGITVEVANEKLLTQTVSGSMPIGDADSFVAQVAKAFQLKATKEGDKFLINE
jgi:transmembrane sensor